MRKTWPGQRRRLTESRKARPRCRVHERADRGRLVATAKGPLSRTLQRSFGDFLINTNAETVRSLELKVERHWTGNLFLETWSNRNLDDRDAHYEHGSTPGWLVTSRADRPRVYFLDSDDLVTVPLLRLKRSAFGSGPQGGVYAWPEKQQGGGAGSATIAGAVACRWKIWSWRRELSAHGFGRWSCCRRRAGWNRPRNRPFEAVTKICAEAVAEHRRRKIIKQKQ